MHGLVQACIRVIIIYKLIETYTEIISPSHWCVLLAHIVRQHTPSAAKRRRFQPRIAISKPNRHAPGCWREGFRPSNCIDENQTRTVRKVLICIIGKIELVENEFQDPENEAKNQPKITDLSANLAWPTSSRLTAYYFIAYTEISSTSHLLSMRAHIVRQHTPSAARRRRYEPRMAMSNPNRHAPGF